MKRLIPLAFCLALFVPICPLLQGCAYLHSTTSKDKFGIETTKTTVYTLFDSKSDMTKYRTSITEKTSGTSIGGLDQASSSTNLNAIIEGVVGAAIKAAKTP